MHLEAVNEVVYFWLSTVYFSIYCYKMHSNAKDILAFYHTYMYTTASHTFLSSYTINAQNGRKIMKEAVMRLRKCC